MIYAIGAILYCLISVRCLNQSHKIYIEQTGLVTKTLSILYAIGGVGAVCFAYRACTQFITYMGW